jgi:hypothetical protein
MSIPAQDSVKENAIENAFARLPRPQKVLDPGKIIVPTRSALLQAAEITKIRNRGQPPLDLFQNPVATVHPSASSPTPLLLTKNSPLSTSRLDTMQDDVSKDMTVPSLGPVITLGTLTQNNVKWDLRAQQGRSGIIMVKRTKHAVGLAEQEIVKHLNHHNVAKLVHSSIDTDGSVCLALEYCRYTLAEVLFVHLKLEEQQVQYIARSVRLSVSLPNADNRLIMLPGLRSAIISRSPRDISQLSRLELNSYHTRPTSCTMYELKHLIHGMS